jgi:hypothetical protein
MQDGYDISCGITIETAFIQKNRVENTILAKLLSKHRAGPDQCRTRTPFQLLLLFCALLDFWLTPSSPPPPTVQSVFSTAFELSWPDLPFFSRRGSITGIEVFMPMGSK